MDFHGFGKELMWATNGFDLLTEIQVIKTTSLDDHSNGILGSGYWTIMVEELGNEPHTIYYYHPLFVEQKLEESLPKCS